MIEMLQGSPLYEKGDPHFIETYFGKTCIRFFPELILFEGQAVDHIGKLIVNRRAVLTRKGHYECGM